MTLLRILGKMRAVMLRHFLKRLITLKHKLYSWKQKYLLSYSSSILDRYSYDIATYSGGLRYI